MWIKNHFGIQELDFDGADRKIEEMEQAETFLGNVDAILLNGAKLILDKVYDSVGFNKIPDDVLCHLVVARLRQPMSKMATVDYFSRLTAMSVFPYERTKYLTMPSGTD